MILETVVGWGYRMEEGKTGRGKKLGEGGWKPAVRKLNLLMNDISGKIMLVLIIQ